MLEQTDINRINLLSTDINKLQEFIDLLSVYKEKKITAMYLILDDIDSKPGNKIQIEFKGNFSNESTKKLFDLIIESREKLIDKMKKILVDCVELTKL